MKEIYTQHTLSQFFEEFKNLPNSYTIEKVHQLLNNPNANAMHTVKFQFNNLKNIIMTSAFIIGVSALFFWLTSKEFKNDKISNENQPKTVELSIQHINNGEDCNKTEANTEIENNQYKCKDLSNDLKKQNISNNDLKTKLLTNHDIFTYNISEKSCIWPLDTVIDKHSLILHLTNKELEKLGVFNRNDSMIYHNKTPDGKYDEYISFLWSVWGGSFPSTNLPFQMLYTTDTTSINERGHHIYEMADTLIPIQTIIIDKPIILWFTPHPAIFDSLPERYKYIKKTYDNLRCIKKLNPNHHIVNYWKKEETFELDNIKFLELSKEKLKDLGFQFFKDSVSLVHPKFNMFYNMGKFGCKMGSQGVGPYGKNAPYPPNPLPVVVTDEKGHVINYYGSGKNRDFDYSMFDLLIPVKISFNELVEGRNYSRIFWFYPTDEFVDALPGEIKQQLKLERDAVIKNTIDTQSSCTYFEVCKSTLKLNDLKVYPNPANQNTTIEFSLYEAISGSIALINISGVQVKKIISDRIFSSGFNSFNANLSDVSPGVYLISIITPNGFKTQRIIITHQ